MTRKRCRKTGEYPLWPADKATADFLGIPFVPVEIVNGEAVPVTQRAPSPAKAQKAAGKDSD
jgi:hypothetical protein